jgi:phosphoglycolate phosphatase
VTRGLDHLVLDLDGTIADSSPGIVLCFRRTLAEFGRVAPEATLRGLIGPPLADSFERLGFAGELHERALERYRVHYDEVGVSAARAYDGVADALAQLQGSGVTLAVATAKREDFAERMLEALGLRTRLAVVAGAPVDGRRVTKAEIVADALSRLGVDPGERTWMVGDRRFDVEAAHQNALACAGALWGYGSPTELEGAGADPLLATPHDLVGLAGGIMAP